MTISTSSESAETPGGSSGSRKVRVAGKRLRRRPPPPTGSVSPPAPSSADAARTVASRFIILSVCLAAVLSAMAFGTVHSWSLGIFAAGAGFVAVAWAADAWRTRRLRLSTNFLQLPLAAFFILGLVQLLPLAGGVVGDNGLSVEAVRSLSRDPYATRFVLIQLGALFVYFAATLTFVDSPKRLRTVVHALVAFGFLLAIFGMIQSVVSPDKVLGVRETKQSLAFGPFINRHHFAGYMELALALPLGLIFAGAVERDRLPLYGFATLLMAAALVLTNSRGGMIALAAEVFFLVMMSGVGRKRPAQFGGAWGESAPQPSALRGVAWRAGIGFAVVFVLFLGAVFFGGEEALNRFFGSVNAADPTTGRLHFWRGTIEIIKDHPFIGAGLGAFSAVYPNYDTSSGRFYRLEQAHNDYLQLLSDGGLVGALIGLVFVVMLFRAGVKRIGSEDKFRRGVALGALSGCFAVLVHSFFDFTLHTTANALLFLILAALATINGRVEEKSQRRRKRRRHVPEVEAHSPTDGGEHSGERETEAASEEKETGASPADGDAVRV